MKKVLFILILILVCSCEKESSYKKAFEEKIKRNIKFRKEIIDYKLFKLRDKLDEQPSRYTEIYLLLGKLNNICNSFVDKSLKINDINQANSIRNNTLKEIKSLKSEYPEIQKIIGELNKPFTNHLDKLECIDSVNEFYFSALRMVVDKYRSDVACKMPMYRSPKPTRVYSYRINDSLVSVLIANNTVIDFPDFFESGDDCECLHVELKSPNDKYLDYQISNCIAAYDVYTTSDTLNLKTTIKTNGTAGFVLTDDEKDLVVGEVLELKTNSKEFIDMVFNRK